MTIGTTNITFSSLQTEFGGANPISLSEYYGGGIYVPDGTTTTMPQSGAIRVYNAFQGSKLPANYFNIGNITHYTYDPGFGTYLPDGTDYGFVNGSYGSMNTIVNQWNEGIYKGTPTNQTANIAYAYWWNNGQSLSLALSSSINWAANGYIFALGNTTYTTDSSTKSFSANVTYFTWYVPNNPFVSTAANHKFKCRFYSAAYGDVGWI